MLGSFEVTIRNDPASSDRSVAPRESRQNAESTPSRPQREDLNGQGEEPSEEAMRTLWVGGVSDKAEEEVLFELFLNAGPVVKVFHPADKETKKKKPFAFIVFENDVSIKYAYDLLNGIELYGQKLRLQHKETGLGIHIGRMNPGMYHSRGTRGRDIQEGREEGGHHRSYSASSLPRVDDRWAGQSGPPQQFYPPPPPDMMMQAMHYPINFANDLPYRGYSQAYDRGYEQERGFAQDWRHQSGREGRSDSHRQPEPRREQDRRARDSEREYRDRSGGREYNSSRSHRR